MRLITFTSDNIKRHSMLLISWISRCTVCSSSFSLVCSSGVFVENKLDINGRLGGLVCPFNRSISVWSFLVYAKSDLTTLKRSLVTLAVWPGILKSVMSFSRSSRFILLQVRSFVEILQKQLSCMLIYCDFRFMTKNLSFNYL